MGKRTLMNLVLLLVVSFYLSGCGTSGSSLESSALKSKIVADTLSDMPFDAAKVISVVGGLMTGNSSPYVVTMNQEISAAILSGAVREGGFVMTDAKLYRYDSGSDPITRNILAVAEFENLTGRRWKEEINVRYRIERVGIRMLDISVLPVFDEIPEAVCFILPADKIPAGKDMLPRTFDSFYQKIAEEAVLPGDTSFSKEAKDWGMVVFFLDRMSPSASVRLNVSADRSGTGGYSKESRYVDYNGWRVGFVAGKYVLMENNSNRKIYMKAVYTPGRGAGYTKSPIIAGLYFLAQ